MGATQYPTMTADIAEMCGKEITALKQQFYRLKLNGWSSHRLTEEQAKILIESYGNEATDAATHQQQASFNVAERARVEQHNTATIEQQLEALEQQRREAATEAQQLEATRQQVEQQAKDAATALEKVEQQKRHIEQQKTTLATDKQHAATEAATAKQQATEAQQAKRTAMAAQQAAEQRQKEAESALLQLQQQQATVTAQRHAATATDADLDKLRQQIRQQQTENEQQRTALTRQKIEQQESNNTLEKTRTEILKKAKEVEAQAKETEAKRQQVAATLETIEAEKVSARTFTEFDFINYAVLLFAAWGFLAFGITGVLIAAFPVAFGIRSIKNMKKASRVKSSKYNMYVSCTIDILFTPLHYKTIADALEDSTNLPFDYQYCAVGLAIFISVLSILALIGTRKETTDDNAAKQKLSANLA